jgi:hypothetical protein
MLHLDHRRLADLGLISSSRSARRRCKRLEQAIERGLIRWHGLPFTTHTELMSPDLFRAGLSYSQELDRRFGMTTIAAKMTDVPGHTLGMVPLLAEAGIRFPASRRQHGLAAAGGAGRYSAGGRRGKESRGHVPALLRRDLFSGRHETDGLSFAHTSDNIGPQSIAQTAECLSRAAPSGTGRGRSAPRRLKITDKLLWDGA